MLDKLLSVPKRLLAKFQKLSQMQQLAIAAVVVIIGWWLYTYKTKMRLERFTESGEKGELVCTMYYTDWCPHCTSAKPEWAKLKQTMDGKFVGGTKIMVVSVDCEKEKDKAQAAGVKGFPTFKFDLNGKSLTYSGKERTFEGFKQYIETLI